MADDDDLGLTFTGFVPERFPEARARVEKVWKGRHGQSSPTAPGTEQGLIIDTIAILVAVLWEHVEDVYLQSFLRFAVERGLDNWVSAFGFVRDLASFSKGEIAAWGTANTVVTATTAVRVGDSGARFTTTEEGAVNDGVSGQTWAVLIQNTDPFVYTIEINPGAEEHELITGQFQDSQVVAQLLADIVNSDSLVAGATVPGKNADGDGVMLVGAQDPGVDITVEPGGVLPPRPAVLPGVRVPVQADVAGPVAAPAGSLNQLVFGVGGIVDVINFEDVTEGASREENGELRRRFLLGQGVNEKATTRAIRSAILKAAEEAGIEGAEVKARENTEDIIVGGLDPHSLAPLVYAPGLDQVVIAQAILDTKANGYKSTGSIETPLVDSGGLAVVIGYTPSPELYLHVRVVIDVQGENWPTEGDPFEAIRVSVATDLTTQGRLQIGTALYRDEIKGPMFDALAPAAIKASTISLATTPGPDDLPVWGAVDLEPADEEILIPSGSRVKVL